jgi:hypothetical protein
MWPVRTTPPKRAKCIAGQHRDKQHILQTHHTHIPTTPLPSPRCSRKSTTSHKHTPYLTQANPYQHILGRKIQGQIQCPTRHPRKSPGTVPKARALHRRDTAEKRATRSRKTVRPSSHCFTHPSTTPSFVNRKQGTDKHTSDPIAYHSTP